MLRKTILFLFLFLSLSLAHAQKTEYTTVSIEPDRTSVIKNPLNGWVMYLGRTWDDDFWTATGYDRMPAGDSGDVVRVWDYCGTAYIRTSWASMEPEEGKYFWNDPDSRLNRLLSSVRARGMRLAFRIVVDGRDQGQNTPMYVIDAGAGCFKSNVGRKEVYTPYPDDPVFQQKYSRFIEALASRFNDNSEVDFIDAYGLGKWGEAHSMQYRDEANRIPVLEWITDLYSRTFTEVPLVINYHRVLAVQHVNGWEDEPDPDSERLLEMCIAKGYSLRHDAFGMNGYYQQWEKDFAARWEHKLPIIMEGGWITGAHHRYWIDPCGKYREGHPEDVRRGEIDESRNAHVNMMDFRVGNETRSWFKNIDMVEEFVREGGYRLYPSSVTVPSVAAAGAKVTVSHVWENLGWGYCPNNIRQWNYRYKPAFALLDEKDCPVRLFVDTDAEPSEWIAGSPKSYELKVSLKDVNPGEYRWAVAIVDTRKGNAPGLNMSVASSSLTSGGWMPLGKVTVKGRKGTVSQEERAISCFARMDADTLSIGNGHIVRRFLWNGGDLMTLSLEDRDNGRVYPVRKKSPDFIFTGKPAKASDGVMTSVVVPADGIRPEHLEVTVSYTYGDVKVKRVFRVYEDAPAIAVDNHVSSIVAGKVAETAVEGGANVADHKNIESKADMAQGRKRTLRLDGLDLGGDHWHLRAVEFSDVTDWNNNLVKAVDFIPYRKLSYRGNLLFARSMEGEGLYFLKEAPCSGVQIGSDGNDFECEAGSFTMTGIGATPGDIASGEWVRLYSSVVGVFGKEEIDAYQSLRRYQRCVRVHMAGRDEMVMMNTWGDRSQDTKVNEQFCLQELEKAARLGVTHFQIDDGWQEGKSPNSAVAKGSFQNIHDNPLYWLPAKDKYPDGLGSVVGKARSLGIELGLWFNPSVQNDFEDWEKDVEAVVRLHREYGVRVFKIDGLKIPSKKAEANLRKFFDTVLEQTGNQVLFNLDATAGRRGGYHMFNEYGNVFLENRYTDWKNYYPYWTLRNLWQLCPYVPAERLQIEFLNIWRNADKYGDDPFAPQRYDFSYVFATAMAGQPLAWMEASNLPEEAYDIAPLVRDYLKVAPDFHEGTILPIGDEPSGRSWTGFQSEKGDEGYVLIYRELAPESSKILGTWLPEGASARFTRVLGTGKDFTATVGKKGEVRFALPEMNSFVMYRYTIKR